MSRYLCWCPDLGEVQVDAAEVEETSPDCAAEQWAEQCDQEGDYPFVMALDMGQPAFAVHVLAPDGTVTRWPVRAEMSYTYTASEALE